MQGSLSEINGIICYDQKIRSVTGMSKQDIKKISEPNGVIVQWGMKDKFMVSMGKAYDYTFLYLKDNNGNSTITLIYVEITFNGEEFECSQPQTIDELQLTQYMNITNDKEYNEQFREMIKDYNFVRKTIKSIIN